MGKFTPAGNRRPAAVNIPAAVAGRLFAAIRGRLFVAKETCCQSHGRSCPAKDRTDSTITALTRAAPRQRWPNRPIARRLFPPAQNCVSIRARFLLSRSAAANHSRRYRCGTIARPHHRAALPVIDHTIDLVWGIVVGSGRSSGRGARGDKTMQYALLASLAFTIALGMWAIWRATP
jgi:hypothetical protein